VNTRTTTAVSCPSLTSEVGLLDARMTVNKKCMILKCSKFSENQNREINGLQ